MGDRLQAALKDLYDSLRPGGILSVTEMMFDPHFQRKGTVLKIARETGFAEGQFFGIRFAYTQNLIKPPAA